MDNPEKLTNIIFACNADATQWYIGYDIPSATTAEVKQKLQDRRDSVGLYGGSEDDPDPTETYTGAGTVYMRIK